MRYLLAHVVLDDHPEDVPCVVREPDGAYLTLMDASVLMQLRDSDPAAYTAVMVLATRLLKAADLQPLTA